ncbi:P-selectin glycoprotein ligand 1 [Stigmatopora nigra]
MTGDCTNGLPLAWLSILLSSALLVSASVETQTRLTPETRANVTDVSRSSRHLALTGSPPSKRPHISATVRVQIHAQTPLLLIGRTLPTPGSPGLTLKPEALSFSQPAKSSEASKSTLGPSLILLEKENTAKMPVTAHLDLSSRHPPIISSISGSQAHSTSFATPSRPPGATSLDLSTWGSSPTPPGPSGSIPNSTASQSALPMTITPGTPSLTVRGRSSTPEPPQGSTSSFVGHDAPPYSKTTERMSFSTGVGFAQETSSRPPSSSIKMTDLATRAIASSISTVSDTTESPRMTAPVPTPGPCSPWKTPPTSRPRPPRHFACLAAIACLAGLAATFLMSTVVLCIQRSGRKYRVQSSPEQTEMTFMSALMPERKSGVGGGRRSQPFYAASFPAIHGVLDSDDDIADNLTLSSFLQDSERFV